MDPSRHARRGRFSGAPRRPRTTAFKDSSVVVDDDDGTDHNHTSKLRERSNKDSSSPSSFQGILPSRMLSASRNKRKRQIPHDARAQSGASPTEGIDRIAQDTEVGASDEGKDVPPHKISGRPERRRIPPGKVRDEYNAVDIVVVPRKLRTACRKRRRESAPVLVTDHQSLPAPTIPPSSPLSLTPSPSSAALKPVKRTKPNGTKFRPSKLVKVSTASTISQQEVEVAEALFDLARMLPASASSFECKSETKPKPGGNADPTFSVSPLQYLPPALVSSPASTATQAQACTPSSPLPSPPFSSPAALPAAISVPIDVPISVAVVVPAAAEAPKRKHPRVRAKIDEVTLTQYEPKNVSAGNSGRSVLEPKIDVNQLTHFAELNRAQVKAEVDIAGSNGSSLLGSGSLHSPVASSFSLLSANCMPATENNFIALGQEKSFNADLSGMDRLDKVLTYLSTVDTKSVLDNTTTCGSKPIQQEITNEYKLLNACSPVTKSQRGKSSSNAPASDTRQQSKCETDLMEEATDASTKLDLIDKESVKDETGDLKRQMGNDSISKEGKSFVSDMEGQMGPDHARHEVKEIQLGNLKSMEKEKENFKLPSRQPGKNVKSDSTLHQKTDRSVSSFPISAPSVSNGATSSISQSQPMSMGMTGWPRSLPHIGYYSPAAAAAAAAAVAAAWPVLPSIGSASVDAALQVPPFILPGVRQQHKRGATHVHIAHFIDAQQQIRRHPLWSATYRNIVAGSGPVFGYPVTQTVASSVSSCLPMTPPGGTGPGGSNNLMSGSSGTETAAAIASCTGSGSVVSTCNSNVVSAAAAQAQYLQAMIQRTGLSCPFPPGHFAASLNALPGHITQQQASQPFGNPFHTASLVPSPQQSPQVSSVGGSAMSPLQDQQLNLQQGTHISQSAPKRQQKQRLSASPSQSQNHISSRRLQYSGDMEGNKGGEIGSSGESGLPSFGRDKCNQALPNAKVPTFSSSCTSAMPAQDFSTMDALGGKQTGRLYNLQHQSSAQLQTQQQRRASTQIQHHLIPLNMSHEGIDLQLSQEFAITSMGVVSRSPIGPGPLGLAPVAAVMAPQGHAILRTMAENVHSHHGYALQEQPHQQPWNVRTVKEGTPVVGETDSSIEESSFYSGSHNRDNVHDKKMPMKQAYFPSGINIQAFPDAQGSVMAKSVGGQTLAHIPSYSGTNLKLMDSPMGNISSQQTSENPAMGRVKVMPNMAGASNDPTSCSSTNASLASAPNKCPVTAVAFQGPSIGIGSHNPRQVGVTSQHSSQAKPSGKSQAGTTALTTSRTALDPGMFVGNTIIRHEGQPAKRQQAALKAMPESRLSTLAASPPSVSKSNNGTLMKGPFDLSQKQTGAILAKRSTPVSHLVPVSHPSKIPAKIGQSQSHKQQKQEDQHKLQQQSSHHHKCHHERQLFPQFLEQQVPVQQTKTLQQLQPLMANEVNQHEYHALPGQLLEPELQKGQQQQRQPSLSSAAHPNEQQSGQELCQEKHQQQQEPSQLAPSHSLVAQKSMPHRTEHRPGQSMQEQSTVTQTSKQHPNLLQPSDKHQSIQSAVSPQQPSLLPSFAVSSSGISTQTSPNSTPGEKITSSDGASMEVEGSGSAAPAKLSGSHGSSPECNSQINDELSPSLLHSPIAASVDAISSTQSSCTTGTNPSTLPDLNSASLPSSSGTMGKHMVEKASTAAAFIQLPMPASSEIVINHTAPSVCAQSIVALMSNTGAQQTAAPCIGGAGVSFQRGSVIAGSTPQVIVSSRKSDSIPSMADTSVSQLKSDAKIVLVAMSGTMHQGVISKPQLPATAGDSLRPTITATSMVACISPSGSTASVCHNPAGVSILEAKRSL